MSPQIQPVGASKSVSMLLYGVPGCGKTRFIGSHERTLIIRPPVDQTAGVPKDAGSEEVVVTDWAGMLEVHQWLRSEGHEHYDWVWLDSLSLMQDVLLDDVMEDALIRKPQRAEAKLAEAGLGNVPEFGADQGEYKINFDRIRKWTRDMVACADAGLFNFGIVCHPFEWYDPVAEEDVWSPWIQGKQMSPTITGYMNLVAYYSEKRDGDGGRKHYLVVDAPGFIGVDKLGCMPALKSGRHGLVDPTMADLDAAINKARGGGRKKTPAKRRRRSN